MNIKKIKEIGLNVFVGLFLLVLAIWATFILGYIGETYWPSDYKCFDSCTNGYQQNLDTCFNECYPKNQSNENNDCFDACRITNEHDYFSIMSDGLKVYCSDICHPINQTDNPDCLYNCRLINQDNNNDESSEGVLNYCYNKCE